MSRPAVVAEPRAPSPVGPRRGRGNPGLWLHWAAAVLVSAGLLAYLFWASDVDPRALGPLLARISVPGLGAFLVVSLAALVLRSLRYWVLLERRVAFGPLVLVTLVRNLFVDLLPARAGAAASYLYLLTARLGLPAEAAIASFALSIVLDTLALAPLLLVALLVVGVAPLPPLLLVGASLLLLLGSGAALVLLPAALDLAARVVGRMPGWLGRAAAPIGRAAGEIQRLDARRVLGPAVVLSLGLRLSKYGAYYCLLRAILAGAGQPVTLDFLRVFLSVAGAELAASLPLPTVASLGPYEAAGALGFAYWLGLPRDLAALAATAFHGLSQLHDYGLGILGLLVIMAPGLRVGRAH